MLTNAETGLCFHEVPLLFENGFDALYDGVIVVKRDLTGRIKSVVERDGLTEQEVLKRIKNQYDYENNCFLAHTVIENDGIFENLQNKVKAIINELEKQL